MSSNAVRRPDKNCSASSGVSFSPRLASSGLVQLLSIFLTAPVQYLCGFLGSVTMYYPLVSAVLPLMALQCLASSINARTPYQVKSSHPVPRQWQKLDRAPADHRLEMRIGLKQSRFNELERELYEGMEDLITLRPVVNSSCSFYAFQSSLRQAPFSGRHSLSHHTG